MKTISVRKSIHQINLVLLAFALTVSASAAFGQSNNSKRNARVIYISSAPKTKGKVKKTKFKYSNKAKLTKKEPKSKKIKPTDFTLEKKAFKLINEKRAKKGLSLLKWNDDIAKLARKHSENMAKHSFFSHVGVRGRMVDQRALDFGLDKWRSIGENIAYNKGYSKPAEFAVERWMLSKGHKRNLLNLRWKESGIGVAVTADGMYFFTQIFMV